MRIALLNPAFWPEVRRGAERLVHDIARGLVEAGERPTLITSHPGRPSTRVEEGVQIVRNRRLPERPFRAAGYHEPLGHFPSTYRTLRAGQFELAHAFSIADAVAAVRWARLRRRPAVFTVTGIPRRDVVLGRRPRRAAWRHVARRADAVVALSEAARSALAWLGSDARVISPGVDLVAFRRTAERSARPTIFCPAAIDDRRKRVDLVIEAFASVRSRWPDARLVLSRPRDVGAVATPTDVPGIELADVDDHAALVRAYSGAWVTVLASRLEAFGLVLLESLACGTPVVGRDQGGIPEVVDSDSIGSLFDDDDPGALATEIGRAFELVDDQATVRACRARAEEFPVERCVEAHLALYRELVGPR